MASGTAILKFLVHSFKIDDETADQIIQQLLMQMDERILIELVQRYAYYLKYREQVQKNPADEEARKQMEYYFTSSDPAPLFQPVFPFHKRHSFARYEIRKYWDTLEEFALHRKEKIFAALCSKSPKVMAVLNTKEGARFVDYAGQRLYWLAYKLAWESPRIHAIQSDDPAAPPSFRDPKKASKVYRKGVPHWSDNGMIRYGMTEPDSLVSTRFYCTACGHIFNPDKWNEESILIKVPYRKPPQGVEDDAD